VEVVLEGVDDHVLGGRVAVGSKCLADCEGGRAICQPDLDDGPCAVAHQQVAEHITIRSQERHASEVVVATCSSLTRPFGVEPRPHPPHPLQRITLCRHADCLAHAGIIG